MSLTACTVGKSGVEAMLSADGYTHIKVGGFAYFGCGEDDNAKQAFEASKNGYRVKGVVCGEIALGGKAPTIRVQSTTRLGDRPDDLQLRSSDALTSPPIHLAT